jgi:hypothetical protein
MATETLQDKVQGLAETKKLLGIAESEPLSCAFALTKDKKDCILLIAKIGKPKKVASTLKKEGGAELDQASMRFGQASFDLEKYPGLVKLTINRMEPAGALMHLNKLAKRASYKGILIEVSEELENEEEEADEQVASGTAPPDSPDIDAAALKRRLVSLAQQIGPAVATEPERKNGLLALAHKAQAGLAANDLQGALAATEELEAALLTPALARAQADVPASAAGAVAYAKSRLAWIAARKKVEAEFEKLVNSVAEQYAPDKDDHIVRQRLRSRLGPLIATFDESLADKLDEATNEADPARRQELVAEARAIISRYEAYIASEPLFDEMDANPFAPTAVKKTMMQTLQALSSAVT